MSQVGRDIVRRGNVQGNVSHGKNVLHFLRDIVDVYARRHLRPVSSRQLAINTLLDGAFPMWQLYGRGGTVCLHPSELCDIICLFVQHRRSDRH